MPNVCLYFQVHQPYRLRDLRITELGGDNVEYFDEAANRMIFRKVAAKCYLPTNKLLLELLQKHPDFRVSFSLSGVFLDQCREYGPDVLESFRALAKTGKVEFLAETYYHSLSALKSLEEFCLQITKHVRTIEELFGQTPTVFRNTELIYCNELAHIIRLMGFRGMLAEGVDHILDGRTPNVPYAPPSFRLDRKREGIIAKHRPHAKRSDAMTLLLKNYRLSDDIAFRFSNKHWKGYPLTADMFCDWLGGNDGHAVNLFMDYETFGEHQWAETGIFEFVRALPKLWEERGVRTYTPSQSIDAWAKNANVTPVADIDRWISWADMERDLSAWQGNDIQNAALDAIYALEASVKARNDVGLLERWRKLQTSDHFYYMCTKYWSDGDVHKYFSPYDSPYEAYRRFSHAIEDLRLQLQKPLAVPAAGKRRTPKVNARLRTRKR